MAAITAGQVKALREETGLPMMECKNALAETGGDTEAAKELLQKKYKGKMESRASNVTGEGRVAVYISDDRKTGAIVDVRCETAPVAKTDQFIELANSIAMTVASQNEPNPTPEAVMEMSSVTASGKTVNDQIMDVFGVLRENMKVFGARKLVGEYLCSYVHHDGKSGVLVALDAVPNPDSVGVDLCHHVVFTTPLAITREEIPADEIARVEQLAREAAKEEGKPDQIVEKIAAGKVNAFCAENALMEQEHIKVTKTKVGDVLKQAGVKAVKGLGSYKIG